VLRSQEQCVTLKEELASIDEYLDIETVRFGPTLVVNKDISEDSLDLVMPSMLLQPLVENAIKHGIGSKVGGGQITIRSRRNQGDTIIEISDDGTGMRQSELNPQESDGIGLRNVDERLRVIYGENYHLTIESARGEGTCARITIPEIHVPHPVTA
jgi:two-component system LytT family sensor kinase